MWYKSRLLKVNLSLFILKFVFRNTEEYSRVLRFSAFTVIDNRPWHEFSGSYCPERGERKKESVLVLLWLIQFQPTVSKPRTWKSTLLFLLSSGASQQTSLWWGEQKWFHWHRLWILALNCKTLVCAKEDSLLPGTAGLKSEYSPPGIFLKMVLTSGYRQPMLNYSLPYGLRGRSFDNVYQLHAYKKG